MCVCGYLHGSDPHAERLGRQRDSANDIRLEVRLCAVLANLLQHAVWYVILIKVHQLFNEVGFTYHTHRRCSIMIMLIHWFKCHQLGCSRVLFKHLNVLFNCWLRFHCPLLCILALFSTLFLLLPPCYNEFLWVKFKSPLFAGFSINQGSTSKYLLFVAASYQAVS